MATYVACYLWKCEVYGKSGRPVKWTKQIIHAKNDDQAVLIAHQRTHVGSELKKVHDPIDKRRVY